MKWLHCHISFAVLSLQVARLTKTPIKHHDTSTNSTLDDDPVTFPLNQPIYVGEHPTPRSQDRCGR